jgi:small subunit ribosomal protein S16
MVKIRLSRKGVRRKAFYRIVAISEEQKASGVPLEVLGWWQPGKAAKFIKKDRVEYWVQKGAQVSKAVEVLLKAKNG